MGSVIEESLAHLPMPQRLALTYAPRATRASFKALFLFDAALADIVRQAREPLLAQMRLAWWRDVLAKDAADRPAGNPLIAQLAEWNGPDNALRGLVDGWEQLLDDAALGNVAMAGFIDGRAVCFEALARSCGEAAYADAALQAGRLWASVDLAFGLSDREERDLALRMARDASSASRKLPRAMRPLAVLAGLADRALQRGQGAILSGSTDVLAAMRLGLFGR